MYNVVNKLYNWYPLISLSREHASKKTVLFNLLGWNSLVNPESLPLQTFHWNCDELNLRPFTISQSQYFIRIKVTALQASARWKSCWWWIIEPHARLKLLSTSIFILIFLLSSLSYAQLSNGPIDSPSQFFARRQQLTFGYLKLALKCFSDWRWMFTFSVFTT